MGNANRSLHKSGILILYTIRCRAVGLQARKSIAVIPGDGVGPEVIAAGRAVVDRVARSVGLPLEWVHFDWGCSRFLRRGMMLPPDAMSTLAGFDAIYLGAIGDPAVPDHIAIPQSILAIRQHFQQFVNYRPVSLFPGIESPIRGVVARDVDILFIRENVEGEYIGVGERIDEGLATERAVQVAEFTRFGIERIARFAFQQAERRRRHLTSITKANALNHSMTLWNEVVAEVAKDFPEISLIEMNVDAAAYKLIMRPQSFDVVVASNLFGDILTDIGAAIQGSLGMAASANLDPTGENPSLFEPVHGSAPDIAGQGRANPSGAMWAGALMLANLGSHTGYQRIIDALAATFAYGLKTQDLGGSCSTEEFTKEVLTRLRDDGG